MLDSFVFTLVDYAMRQTMNTDIPFGGKQIILVGDFMQLPPVECLTQIFECDSFLNGNFKTHYLTSNHRQDVNSDFYKILQECRYNRLSRQSLSILKSRETNNPPHDILHIYATNAENNSWNNKMFEKLEGTIKTYSADDEFIHSSYAKMLDNGCMAEKELKLKNNARVILLRNLDFERGLVNGSCGYVRDMQKNQVVVEFDNGEMQTIKPAIWEWTQRDDVIASRKQIPLKLAYSITVHKSQGMTLDRAYIDLTKIFAEGQAYVALSRLRTLDGLYLKGVKSTSFRTNVKAKQFYEQIENELKER
jgi:ATP-dependent exoDNAse (exonuclease V) alpha subunit